MMCRSKTTIRSAWLVLLKFSGTISHADLYYNIWATDHLTSLI